MRHILIRISIAHATNNTGIRQAYYRSKMIAQFIYPLDESNERERAKVIEAAAKSAMKLEYNYEGDLKFHAQESTMPGDENGDERAKTREEFHR